MGSGTRPCEHPVCMAVASTRSDRVGRIAQVTFWSAAFGFGLLTLAVARSEPGGSFGGASWAAALAELVAGWALIGAGLYLSLRRPRGRSGYLLAAAGVAWFFVEWNNPGIGSSVGFTFGLVSWALAAPMVALAVLIDPSGRSLPALDRVAVVGAFVAAGLLLGLLPALFFDPQQQACNLCPANLVVIRSDPDTVHALNRWGVRLGLVWSIALAALVVWRFARSSAPLRRVAAPVVLGGVVYFLLVWGDFAHSLTRGELSNDPFEQRLRLGEAAALCAIALGVAWSWLRARRTRSAMARLVVELGESPPAGGLREVLASALGDRELEVAYPLVDPDRYVDARGKSIDLSTWADRAVTPLAQEGTTVAVLIHRKGLLDDPGLVQEVIAAARIALENERLEAEVRAQLEDLRASRARVVATGDAERKRLERDLHDGAQQRLVGLSLALRLARPRFGADPEPDLMSRIDHAEGELRLAIDELRELAHGIYPAVLVDEGLAAAVEALAERSLTAIRIVAIPQERFRSPVEAAAYFFIAEAAGPIAVSTGATSTTVEVEHVDDELLVKVTEHGGRDPNPEAALLVDLADRVGALDGRTGVGQGSDQGLTLRAEIPLREIPRRP